MAEMDQDISKVPVLETRVEAVEKAVVELEERVDRGFGRIREQIESAVKGLSSEIQSTSQEHTQSKRNVMGLIAAMAVGVGSAVWGVIQLQNAALVGPMKENINALSVASSRHETELQTVRQNEASLLAQGSRATEDRSHTRSNVESIDTRLKTLETATAAYRAENTAKLTEIETQFNMSDQVRNVQWSEQQRINAILWNKQQKDLGTYPTGPFFQPNVSQHAKP